MSTPFSTSSSAILRVTAKLLFSLAHDNNFSCVLHKVVYGLWIAHGICADGLFQRYAHEELFHRHLQLLTAQRARHGRNGNDLIGNVMWRDGGAQLALNLRFQLVIQRYAIFDHHKKWHII